MLKLKFNHPEYSDDQLNSSIFDIIQGNMLLSMATIKSDASWINTAFYCFNDSLDVYILTEVESQHGKNLLQNKSVAATIFDSHQPWGPGKLRGLQLFGTAEKAEGLKLIEAVTLYVRRFPGVTKWLTKPQDLLEGLKGSWMYAIKVEQLKMLDELNFGEENYITVRVP